MPTMPNLPLDVLEEKILSRAPVTFLRAMRSTCKKWNNFSKKKIIPEAARKQQGLMLIKNNICSLSFSLQGIHKDDFVVPSINQVNIPDHIKVDKIFHCDGILLCVIEKNSSLVVWNPYLGQTRRIKVSNDPDRNEKDRKYDRYALGYDNDNGNHKILRIMRDFKHSDGLRYEIYRFASNSWSLLDEEVMKPDWNVWSAQRSSVSLKGNTYFFLQGNDYGNEEDEDDEEYEDDDVVPKDNFLLCFDYTTESFGPRLLLPFNPHVEETVALSCVGEERLAMLYQSFKTSESIEIWVTDKIDPKAVSWSKFLKVDTTPLTGFPVDFYVDSFFIDAEKKVVAVVDVHYCYQKAHIIGEDGYLKCVNMERAPDVGNGQPLVFSSYVPSLVKVPVKQPKGKRKGISSKTKSKKNKKGRKI
ncbi:F-box associated domain type 1 [Arabidopsis thaliana x Arabidopsis arenosa]|uniref:F-box associated domain type 1 n=1 Tax=Arabidopsis thaliana x Arabidopsis arenosa TaxID=1240361 RepID=A0A8T2AZ39_9BRAS|nr:F-box associated domain type 1 [Arabidopsis thaliana x Arabidopsis arenosa]